MIRPRRNRKSNATRALLRETYLVPEQLIYPLFLVDGQNIKSEVSSLPGNYRWSLDLLLEEIAIDLQALLAPEIAELRNSVSKTNV